MPNNALRDKNGRYLKGTQTRSDEERFWGNVEKTESCWLWKGSFVRKGYGSLFYKGKQTRAHRISWMIHFGNIPEGLHVCHSCDNPQCTNPDHLWIGTNYENRQDSVRKGRTNGGSSPGSKHPCSKLTEDQVLQIREIRKTTDLTFKEIGNMFGIDYSTAGDICRRKTWKHI